jgi:hypothetical protein
MLRRQQNETALRPETTSLNNAMAEEINDEARVIIVTPEQISTTC